MRPLRYVIDWEWALRAALHAPQAFRYLDSERLLDYRLHGRNTILRGALRGACEVNRLHRELLARYRAPAPIVAALYRNQRLLRRNWRAAGEATAERLVRAREADVAQLQAQVASMEGFVRDREADVAQLQAQLASTEGFVRDREADVARLQAENARLQPETARLQAETARLQAEAARQQATVATLRTRLDQIESSLPWRTLSALRRLAGR
jgi:hypothetical protein